MTALYTIAALIAFASNSVLCRIALGRSTIDAATFSTVRLLAGAVALLTIQAVSRGSADTDRRSSVPRSWMPAILLFLYAVPFSFAYVSLSTGTGALILFGSVQTTIMAVAVLSGERPHPLQWTGLALALSGLVYLVSPGLAAPSLVGSISMVVAGVSWGFYTLRGRGISDPLAQTTSNFVRAFPLTLAVSLLATSFIHVETIGVLLAAVSGALSSGVGYVLWYSALRGLTATRAAVVQVSVPILAATGGVLFMGEAVTLRLVVAAIVVLGGTAVALLGRERLALRTAPAR